MRKNGSSEPGKSVVQEWEQHAAYRELIRAAKAEAWDEAHDQIAYVLENKSWPEAANYLGDNPYREEQ